MAAESIPSKEEQVPFGLPYLAEISIRSVEASSTSTMTGDGGTAGGADTDP